MITVKLLGGAKRSFATDRLSIDRVSMTVSDLLVILRDLVPAGRPAFDATNLLVAINGIDSSSMEGNGTCLKDGDVVSIIPVVHGGGMGPTNFRVSGYNVTVIRIGMLAGDPAIFLENLRSKYPEGIIQGVRTQYALSIEHARRIIELSIAASKSGTLLSNKIETDLLMRFATSRQISDAINKTGLKKGKDSLLIVIGPNAVAKRLINEISDLVKPLQPYPNNSKFLKKEFGITRKELACTLSREPLEDLLVEKSSVLFY